MKKKSEVPFVKCTWDAKQNRRIPLSFHNFDRRPIGIHIEAWDGVHGISPPTSIVPTIERTLIAAFAGGFLLFTSVGREKKRDEATLSSAQGYELENATYVYISTYVQYILKQPGHNISYSGSSVFLHMPNSHIQTPHAIMSMRGGLILT